MNEQKIQEQLFRVEGYSEGMKDGFRQGYVAGLNFAYANPKTEETDNARVSKDKQPSLNA